MQLPIDDRILETLAESELILSPAVIAINIDKSRDEVNRRLRTLEEHGFVTRVQRGYYKATDTAEQYLAGTLSRDEVDLSATDEETN